MASVYTNTDQNGSVQLATMKDVSNMGGGSGLGGRLIGTYKFSAGRQTTPATITLTSPADYLIVNVITGDYAYRQNYYIYSPSGGGFYSGGNNVSNSAIVYVGNTRVTQTVVYKGGDAYIPSTMGWDSDSDGEPEYCNDAFVSAEISLSSDGLTITNKSHSSDSPAMGTIEVYSLS